MRLPKKTSAGRIGLGSRPHAMMSMALARGGHLGKRSIEFLQSGAVSEQANAAIVPRVDAILDDEVHDVRIPAVHPIAMQGRAPRV